MDAMKGFTSLASVNNPWVLGAQLGSSTIHVDDLDVVIDYECR